MSHRHKLVLLMGLLPITFVVVLSGLSQCAHHVRWDLTEDRLHTVSEGAEAMLKAIEDQVVVQVYFSEQGIEAVPALQFYATRVGDFLDELSRIADGQLIIEWKDPIPFSEAEDAALLAGLTGLPIGDRGDPVYFGLMLRSSTGATSIIPFLSPEEEYLLEYQLLQALDEVTRPRRPRVALLTDLPIQSWVIYADLQSRYDLIEVPLNADALPSEVDLLMLVQPSELNDGLFQALETALNAGQRFLILVDPLIQSIGQSAPPAPRLMELLQRLGVEVELRDFVADARLGLQVTLEAEAAPILHPAILGLSGPSLNREDVVTAQLEAINIASAGVINPLSADADGSGTLWRSSLQSALLPVERLLSASDVAAVTAEIMAELPAVSEPLTMAMRVTEPSDAVVIADVDFLADEYWVSRRNLLGTEWFDRFASNGSFVLNVIDNLVGDPALIDLRSRDISLRSFDLVDELRRSAEIQLLATEQRLEAALESANQQLMALRSEQTLGDLEETQAQMAEFVAERARLRQELRMVRRDLDRHIDRLGQQLTWVNILLMPVLIFIAYLLGYIRRRMKRH